MKNVAGIIYPLSRGVTKSGQSVSYRAGDDGVFEAGWWLGRLLANNIQRFIAHPEHPDDLVIDRATRLIWPREADWTGGDGGTAQSWNSAIDYCNALEFCNYTDWRLPSAKELASIVDYGQFNPSIDTTYFENMPTGGHWTSSTYQDNTTYGWFVRFDAGLVSYTLKTNLRSLLAVRGGL